MSRAEALPSTTTDLLKPRRDGTLDVIRGGAIISMTAGHVAGGSLLAKVVHFPFWMDGAIVFVVMSGLVLGLVQRKATDRTGAPKYTTLLRRAGFLYVVQFAILALAVAARLLTGRPENAPDPGESGGWLNTLFYAASLQLPAPNLTILSMYVVLLLAAVGIVWLFARRLAWAALLLAAAIWAVGTIAPQLTVMPHVQESGYDRFNWATWLLPFTLGLVIGWHWSAWKVDALLRRTSVLLISIAALIALSVTAHIFGRLDLGGGTGDAVASFFQKWDLGLGVILFGAVVITVAYGIIVRIGGLPVIRNIRAWLELLGSWSLDCFVILCIAVVVAPALLDYGTTGRVGMLLVAVVLVIMTIWSALRQRDLIPLVKKKNRSAPAR